MPTFVVVKDKFNDQYASQIYGEANTSAIKRTAKELIESTACCDDDDELLLVGIVPARLIEATTDLGRHFSIGVAA